MGYESSVVNFESDLIVKKRPFISLLKKFEQKSIPWYSLKSFDATEEEPNRIIINGSFAETSKAYHIDEFVKGLAKIATDGKMEFDLWGEDNTDMHHYKIEPGQAHKWGFELKPGKLEKLA